VTLGLHLKLINELQSNMHFLLTAARDIYCFLCGWINSGETMPTAQPPTGTLPRLLLVEDELINQLVTKSILAKSGYQVDVASNGREAIKALENDDYAIVLMDCMMPVMNGFEATVVIRDESSKVRNHVIPVIALTAKTFREDRDSCLAVGMDDYLAKPLDVAKLLSMLKKWLPPGSWPGSAQPEGQELPAGEDAKSCVTTNDIIFDIDKFLWRNQGDLELCRKVANVFISRPQEHLEPIRKAVAARDAVALRHSAHQLKGAAAILELPSLAEAARKVETIARSGDLESAGQMLEELELRFEQAVDALRKLPSGTKRIDV
jgi:two-component system sensor histidine kinase/response regulator